MWRNIINSGRCTTRFNRINIEQFEVLVEKNAKGGLDLSVEVWGWVDEIDFQSSWTQKLRLEIWHCGLVGNFLRSLDLHITIVLIVHSHLYPTRLSMLRCRPLSHGKMDQFTIRWGPHPHIALHTLLGIWYISCGSSRALFAMFNSKHLGFVPLACWMPEWTWGLVRVLCVWRHSLKRGIRPVTVPGGTC